MITMTNTDNIDSDASYAAFVRDDAMPEIAHQFGIVSGSMVRTMLATSTRPEALEFHPL